MASGGGVNGSERIWDSEKELVSGNRNYVNILFYFFILLEKWRKV